MENTHPLAVTLARIPVSTWQPTADIGTLEAGWFRATEMCENEARLDEALALQAADHPNMEARTRASYLIGFYSWYLPAAAITALLAERRVPDLSPENVALQLSTIQWQDGEYSGESQRLDVRFLSGRFAALPDDPDANHPDALILPNETALREWLRNTIEAHFTPMIEQLFAKTRLGRQAQWNLVADACAALFLGSGELVSDQPHGEAQGLAFVKAPGSHMENPKTGYFTLEYEGHCETYRARGGCCRYYTVAEDAEKCSTCVLVKPEERDQRLLAYMAQRYAPAVVS